MTNAKQTLPQDHSRTAERPAKTRQYRLELLVTGLVLGASLSIPLTVLGMSWIREHLPILAAVMIALSTVALLVLVVIFKYRRQLLESAGLQPDVQMQEVLSKLSSLPRQFLSASSQRDFDFGKATEESEEALRALVSWYVWTQSWRRVVILMLALLGGVGALVGATLLSEQNRFFREQNAKIQTQIEQQASDTLIVRRAQLLATIYEVECENLSDAHSKLLPEVVEETGESDDSPEMAVDRICRPRASFRARQEAALAFIEIERGRGAQPDLSLAYLNGTILRNADLSNTDLRGANLLGANLIAANLSGAHLGGANVKSANFDRANLSGALLSEARNLTQEQIDDADRGDEKTLLPAGLEQPLHWTLWSGVDVWNQWRQKHRDQRPNLFEPYLSRADLRGANLSNTDLFAANFFEADLSGADFSGANLFFALLRGAKLSEANFLDADLQGADLRDTDLRRVKNISQNQIARAQGNASTKLPPYLKHPRHWLENDD